VHNTYIRLFVATGKGTQQQAEDSLQDALEESRSEETGAYVPVNLHQPIPKLRLKGLDGKAVTLGIADGPSSWMCGLPGAAHARRNCRLSWHSSRRTQK
jgi:hypothetical protein